MVCINDILAAQDDMRKFAAQILGVSVDHVDVDTIVAMAEDDALRGLSGFRGDSALSTWLYRIVERQIKQEWAEQPARNRRLVRLRNQCLVDVDDEDEGITLEELEEAFEDLPPEYQRIISMRFEENMTLVEISERTGLSFATVRRREKKGLEELRKALRGVV